MSAFGVLKYRTPVVYYLRKDKTRRWRSARMMTLLVCAYCERSIDDIMTEQPGVGPDEALKYVLIGDNRVQLCSACAGDRPAMTDAEMWSLLNGPVELPPGTTAIDHTCPLCLYDGFSEEEATFRLELEPLDEKPGYLYAHCKECAMTVISKEVQKQEEDPII